MSGNRPFTTTGDAMPGEPEIIESSIVQKDKKLPELPQDAAWQPENKDNKNE